jgi:transposase
MSTKELSRLEVMQKLSEKRMSQKEAASVLAISVRHVKRLLRAYRRYGAQGLISKRRGRPSNNRLAEASKQKALDLLKSKYQGFGPTLAHEKLVEGEGLKISDESIRQLMIAEGLWKARKARKVTVHQMRERRACFGELVQIDGSPHAWLEDRGPACSLLVYIDDATGCLGELRFVESESFFSYAQASRAYFERHGKPVAFYSDKHGIFRVNAKNALSGTGVTQFGRAMKSLDIELICANTPQAKGRVERVNLTLQDRLVKELRLRNISTIEAANAFVSEYIEEFNRRFAVQPRSSHDAHRPLLFSEDELNRILSWQETRILSKNLTLQFRKVIYQIQTRRPSYALRKAQVTLCENPQGEITILYKGKPLQYSIFHKQQRQAEVLTSKEIDTHLKKKKKPHKPAADHPWRQYGRRINGKPVEGTFSPGNDHASSVFSR